MIKNTPNAQLIDKSKVVPMQRINYFQYSKSNNMNGYIFSRRNPATASLLRSGTEANITIGEDSTRNPVHKNAWEKYNTTQICLQATLKLPPPCQLPVGEPNEGDSEIFPPEDCSIAEEFGENEEPIAVDLAKREVEKTYKFPKLSNTPRMKIGGQGLAFLFDRKRSITLTSANTHGLFFRGKSSLNTVPEKPVPANRVMKERVNIVPPTVSQKPVFDRMRTNSTDSYIGNVVARLGQKENMGAGNIHMTTPKNVIKGPAPIRPTFKTMKTIHTTGGLEKELKEKFSFLINKGPHKFSNTAQAQPKTLIKKENSIELTCECSEILGDELSTIYYCALQ